MNAPDSAPTKLLPGALSAVDLPSEVARLIPEGQPFDAHAFLEHHPELANDKSLVLTLAYKEFWQLKDEGKEVDCEAFCNRFPHHKNSLRQLLALHQFFENSPDLLTDVQQSSWPQPGTDFLGYRIERELGRGGLARVYLAKETALGNRPVAIKVSRLELGEAQTLGRLRHPNIVPVHSVQSHPASGTNVICMPYLGSATLCDVLDRAYATGMPTSADVIREAAQKDAPLGENAKIRGAYIDAVVGIGAQKRFAFWQDRHETLNESGFRPTLNQWDRLEGEGFRAFRATAHHREGR